MASKHDPNLILKFIIEYKKAHDGNSPSLREISLARQITSTSMVKRLLEQMDAQGLIYYGRAGSRGIQVVGGQWIFRG